MSDVDQQEILPTVEELTTPQPDSTDPAYLAWIDEKVRKSLKHAEENPEDCSTHDEVFGEITKKFLP